MAGCAKVSRAGLLGLAVVAVINVAGTAWAIREELTNAGHSLARKGS
jgi:hypothetical protein